MFFGDVKNDNVAKLQDINRREFLFLAILAVMVLFFGLYPAPLIEVMDASVANLVQHMMQSKL